MKNRKKLVTYVLFAMYGAMMFTSKIMMEGLPNIHPLTMFIVTLSVVYGIKALIPIYIYVFLNGLYAGFNLWWLPYLYLWAVQCLITLLIPRKISDKWAAIIYPLLCGVFGITYGIMYAPAQAILFGLSFKQTLVWISTGIPYDILHCGGNVAIGLLVLPLTKVIKKLHSSMRVPI